MIIFYCEAQILTVSLYFLDIQKDILRKHHYVLCSCLLSFAVYQSACPHLIRLTNFSSRFAELQFHLLGYKAFCKCIAFLCLFLSDIHNLILTPKITTDKFVHSA